MTKDIQKKTLSLMGICAIMLTSSLTIMVGSAITSALPDLALEFNIPVSLSGWLVTVPAFGVIVTALFFGRLIDRHGARMVCSIGLLCYGVLGVIGMLMPEIVSMLIDRFLLGVAAAAIMTSATALISDFYHGHKRLRMIAVQGMAIEVGGIVFLSLGGFLAELSWRGPFFIYAIAFIAWIWLTTFIPKSKKEIRVDGRNETDEHETASGKIWPVILLSFLAMFIFFSGIVALPVHLQVDLGYGKSFTGNYLAFISLIAVIMAGIMPRIVKGITAKGTLSAAFVCFAAAFLLYYSLTDIVSMVSAAVLMGIGFGLTIPLLNHLTVERSRKEVRGRNIGFYAMATFCGQFLSSIVSTIAHGQGAFGVVTVIAVLTLLYTIIGFKNK